MNKNIKRHSVNLLCDKLSNLAPSALVDKTGREYLSVEHMYQTWKCGSFSKAGYEARGKKVKGDFKLLKKHSMDVMTRAMKLKLRAHSALTEAIRAKGGLEWLATCTHVVYGRDKHWECVNGRGAFMVCLINAYANRVSVEKMISQHQYEVEWQHHTCIPKQAWDERLNA